MFTQAELAVLRRAYARQVTFLGNVRNAALERAYAEVPREAYLGPGPWPILRWPSYPSRPGYTPTPDADPAWLYADTLVGIVPERGLNNGQPSAHACWIAAAAPSTGERVVHVGAGVGYYSAIMAHMVGSTGAVTAIEYDPQLASRAAANFAHAPNVEVVQGDGSVTPFAPADVIYVNGRQPSRRRVARWPEGGRPADPAAHHRPELHRTAGLRHALRRRIRHHPPRRRLRRLVRGPDRRVPLRRHAGRGVRAGPRGGFRQGRIPRREAAASDG
jgi:protein-L-isoaspartate(D-aspartate) O-methyltransferase